MMNSLSLNWIDHVFSLLNFQGNSTGFQQPENTTPKEPESKIDHHHLELTSKTILEQLTVGVFFHHRDVKVALEELSHAGFPISSLTLMAPNCQRYNWLSELNIFSHFEKEIFSFSQECQQFFQKFFRRGKYILVVEGTEDMVQFAAQVLSRRRDHSKVWYFVKNIENIR